MKVKDRDEARQLLHEIDELSEAATLMNNTLECLRENGGKVKLLVRTGGKDTVSELDENTAGIVMREIISVYNGAITVRKSKLEVVIRNAIVAIS